MTLHAPPLGALRPTATTLVSRPDLDIVIPAFNEERRIGQTLTALAAHLVAHEVSARILVVDNGSVDSTVDTVHRAHTQGVTVRLVNCSTPGKGAAVRAGVRHSSARTVAYLDADQSIPPESLTTGLALLDRGWDVVIGSRRATGGEYAVQQPLLRRLGSAAFRVASSGLVGRVSDTQCGLKMFSHEAAVAIFDDSTIDGFAFDVEVIARARAHGLRHMELPVVWSDNPGSSFSAVRHGARAFHDVARLRVQNHRSKGWSL